MNFKRVIAIGLMLAASPAWSQTPPRAPQTNWWSAAGREDGPPRHWEAPHQVSQRQDPRGPDQHYAPQGRLVDAEGGGQGDREHSTGHRPGQSDQPLEQSPEDDPAAHRQRSDQ